MSARSSWPRSAPMAIAGFWVAIAPFTAAIAQTIAPTLVRPDTTLPNPTVAVPTDTGAEITGGTTAGSNLFHSFESFSIPSGSDVRFAVEGVAIDNIITRVTGDLASQLDGTLSIEGSANFFLLNPNGVFFGPNASLDLRGAFAASTADAIGFGANGQFAADPTASTNPQLLTVSPSALFFNQLNPAPIRNAATGLSVDPGQSLLLVGGDTAFNSGQAIAPGGNIGVAAIAQPAEIGLLAEGNSLRLAVPEGVVGAPFALSNGASLLTSSGEAGGGRIEVRAGDITLSSNAEVRAETFGAIASEGIEIRGSSLSLSEGAVISTSTFGPGDAGDISIDTGAIEISGNSPLAPLLGSILPGLDPTNPAGVEIPVEQLQGSLFDGAFAVSLGSGNAGNISFNAEAISLQEGAAIAATSFLPDGGGAGGDLNIAATESVAIAGGSFLGSGTTGAESSGTLTIATPQLQVASSLVTTSTGGSGAGGLLSVSGTGSVELSGSLPVDVGDIPISGGLFTATVGSGAAGDLNISTGTLVVRDGASAATTSLAAGSGGTLTVNATEAVELMTQIPGTGALSASATNTGDGGSIFVTTPHLSLSNGGAIAANTFDLGNGGDIAIDASLIEIGSGGAIAASTLGGLGNGGDIEIVADRLEITGQASLSPLLGLVLSVGIDDPGDVDFDLGQVFGSLTDGLFALSLSFGDAGDITLNVGELSVQSGAISATSFIPESMFGGGGVGGTIEITATESVTIAGGSILATGSGGAAPSGDITVSAPQLSILDSVALTSAAGSGEGGSITIVDADLVELAGDISVEGLDPIPGGLFTATVSEAPNAGDAGDITIGTGTLIIRDQASALTNSVNSPGASGNIIVTATEAIALSESFVGFANSSLSATTTGSGPGGDIAVNTPNLTLSNGGTIGANTEGIGNGGNITIDAGRIEIVGGGAIAASTLEGIGDGGSINITADRLTIVGQNSPSLLLEAILPFFDSSNPDGLDIDFEAFPEQISNSLTDGVFVASLGLGDAGDIDLDVGELSLDNGATISATSFLPLPIGGAGGQVAITATESVALTNGSLIASGGGGAQTSGDVIIATPLLQVFDSLALTATAGIGEGGDVFVQESDLIELSGTVTSSGGFTFASGLTTATVSSGNAGDVNIKTGTLVVRDQASVLTDNVTGSGSSGNITIVATEAIELSNPLPGLDNASLSATADENGSGNGGNIEITTPLLTLSEGGSIAANTFGPGDGGNVTINGPELLSISGGGAIAASTFGPGNGGNVTITDAGAIEITGLQPFELILALLGATDPTAPPSPDTVALFAESGIFTISAPIDIDPDTGGLPGSIEITGSGSISATNGAVISTATFGGIAPEGAAAPETEIGSLDIDATDIFIESSILGTNTFGPQDAGNLTITTDRLTAVGGSLVTTTALNAGSPGSGGDLTVIASESIDLAGTIPLTSFGGLITTTIGNGNAGEIDITTDRLTVRDGAQISSSTTNIGNGGNILIDATEIVLEGTSPLIPNFLDPSEPPMVSPSGITATASTDQFSLGLAGFPQVGSPSGNAGNVDIDLLNDGQLSLSGGATIAASADLGTTGMAGTVAIDAGSTEAGTVSIAGFSADGSTSSAIAAVTFGTGPAQSVSVRAETIELTDGGAILAGTLGFGTGGNIDIDAYTVTLQGVPADAPLATGFYTVTLFGPESAGNLTINAHRLAVLDGALATTSSAGLGTAGILEVNVSDSITVAGMSEDGQLVSAITSTALGVGDAGDLFVRAGDTLQITDNGFVGAGTSNPFIGEDIVFSFPGVGPFPIPETGTGNAGMATITAETVELDNGNIGIETAGGGPGANNEGSLFLNVDENLFLLNGSTITATALGDTNGGNINIDASNGSVVLTDSSSIVADAEQAGNGGNIQINATGLFVCADCSITASADVGTDGLVDVSSPEVNPADSLVILPAQLPDSSEQIVTGCAAQEGNRFAVVGRGGLPPDPGDRLQAPGTWTDLRDFRSSAATTAAVAPPAIAPARAERSAPKFQEAAGWHRNANGEVELLAAAPTNRWQLQTPHCGSPATIATPQEPDAAPALQEAESIQETKLKAGALLP